ncbi:Rne/Rng family ribonuclease [Dongia soli]|uniref:Ribonuclease E n=1 Tax=Dongia soli TaxID=600628 RepID=A0ABU5EE24_9PROT|nr:Rne/Rng family ribonuclease [Dongia soli]MDY0883698.1 Rne/Rng family ribonuclease [Dongia soli]
MAKTMLIDATHPEETRVAVVDGRKLEEFDVEVATRRPLKGNIYLAKVTRVEPSLQAAFVEYGGNRHGFLAFSEIHPDYYRIPVADREALMREAAEALEEDDDDIDASPEDSHHHHDDDHHHDDHGHDHDDDYVHDENRPDEHVGEHPADHHPGDEQSVIVSESGEFVAAPLIDEAPGTSEPAGQPSDHRNTEEAATPPASSSEPAVMALESRRDVLHGDIIVPANAEGSEAEVIHPPSAAEENAGPEAVAVEGEILPPNQAEIVEVPVREDVIDTVGGEEPAIQDDPEADEERARRRRQRNMRRYKIQEVIKRRQILLVQVTKEERGNKGAALTTYLSLAGRYCVLMPNTDRGGGISRRITNANDRKRLKSIIDDLDAPEGMAVIVRTAGSERSKAEVKRDFEYLLRLWDEIREVTLRSTAPALIYEEASLIKRSIRDLYTRDIGDIIVAGDESYRAAKSFMRMLTPSHAKRVQLYRDNSIPLFQRYQIESQLSAIHQPVVQLKSGGYIVINQTEALVAIDVNSGRATKERNIEETALRTNQEAAEEVARQLRLRDLAGLIVIDFIDMEENRNNAAVERRLKESLKNDRARIQIGRISSFGLLEMSRQRLHPSLAEASTEICPHCAGTGRIRSVDSTALHVLRMVEEEITRSYSPGVSVFVPAAVALYILNQKRASLAELEMRRGVRIYLQSDDSLIPPDYRLERIKQLAPGEEVEQRQLPPAKILEEDIDIEDEADIEAEDEEAESETEAPEEVAAESGEGRGRRRRRRRRGGRGERFRADEFTEASENAAAAAENGGGATQAHRDEEGTEIDEAEGEFAEGDGEEDEAETSDAAATEDGQPRRRRRRGRRGGRRRSRRQQDGQADAASEEDVSQEDANQPGEPTLHPEPAVGFGEQPDLPDALPLHWQQHTLTPVAARDATITIDSTVEADDAPAAGPKAETPIGTGEGEAVTEAVAGDAPAAIGEPGPETATPRRRAKREDGERAPRTRKPRRSREEAAAPAASAAPVEDVAAASDADVTSDIAVAAEPAYAPPSPPNVEAATSTANVGAVNESVSTSITVIEIPSSGDPAVTVLDKPSDDNGEPKRRGWWRRLME